MKRIVLFMVCIFLLPAIFAEASTKDKNVRLIQAAERGNLTDVQIALNGGADVNAKGNKGWTALIAASYCGYTYGSYAEVVKLLLAKGADVNVKNSKGKTALVIAKDKGKTEIVGMLERAGTKE